MLDDGQPDLHVDQFRAEAGIGVVHGPFGGSFNTAAQLLRSGAQLLALGFGLRYRADAVTLAGGLEPVGLGQFLSGLPFRSRRRNRTDGCLFGLALRVDQLDLLLASGAFDLAHCFDGLGCAFCLGAGRFGLGADLALFLGLGVDFDAAVVPGQLDGDVALDVAFADFLLGGDAPGLEFLVARNPGEIDGLARPDPGLLGLAFLFRFPRGDFAALLGAPGCDRPLLFEAGEFLVARDLELFLFRLQVAQLDLDFRILLDLVALAAPALDFLGQPGQALGVERVLRIEMLAVGLVEAGERHRLQFETDGGQIVEQGIANPPHELDPLLVQLLHGHLGGDRAQGVGQAPFDELLQQLDPQRLGAQALRRRRNGLMICADADEEIGRDIDPQTVLGDQGVARRPRHIDPQRVHVDLDDVVQDRQHQGATVHDHLLAAEAGADERQFLGRAAVEPPEQQPENDDRDECDDNGGKYRPERHRRFLHISSSASRARPNSSPVQETGAMMAA